MVSFHVSRADPVPLQNKVYDPVPASEGDGRLCPVLRKRVQSFTFTAGKDHDKYSFADHSV